MPPVQIAQTYRTHRTITLLFVRLLSNAPSGLLQRVTVQCCTSPCSLLTFPHCNKTHKEFPEDRSAGPICNLLACPASELRISPPRGPASYYWQGGKLQLERESGLHLHGKVVHHQPSEPCCAQYGDFEQRFTSIQSVALVTVTRGSEESSNSSLRDQLFCIMQ